MTTQTQTHPRPHNQKRAAERRLKDQTGVTDFNVQHITPKRRAAAHEARSHRLNAVAGSIMLSRPVLIKCYHMHVRSLRVAGDQTLFVSTDITQMGCTAVKASPYTVLCMDVEAPAWFWVDFGRAPPHHSVYLQCRREEGLECSLAVTKHNLSCTRTRLLAKLHKHCHTSTSRFLPQPLLSFYF